MSKELLKIASNGQWSLEKSKPPSVKSIAPQKPVEVANNRKGGIRRGKIDPAKAAEVDALLGVKPEVPATEVKPEKVKTIIRRGVDRKLAASVDEENSLEKCEAIIEKLEELVKTGEHPSVKSANAKIKQLGLPGGAQHAGYGGSKSKGASIKKPLGGHIEVSHQYSNTLPPNHPDHKKMEELHNHIMSNHDVEHIGGGESEGDYQSVYRIKGPK